MIYVIDDNVNSRTKMYAKMCFRTKTSHKTCPRLNLLGIGCLHCCILSKATDRLPFSKIK